MFKKSAVIQGEEEPVIVKTVRYFSNAFESSISSIVLQPRETTVDILYDNSVVEQLTPQQYDSIRKRIKLMSQMDISLKEMQEGVFELLHKKEDYRLKISSSPTQYGERLEIMIEKIPQLK